MEVVTPNVLYVQYPVSEEIGLFSNEHTIDRGRRLCEVNTDDDYQQIVRHYQSLQNVNIQADPQVLCRDEVNEFSFASLTLDTDENELNSVFSGLLQDMTSTSNTNNEAIVELNVTNERFTTPTSFGRTYCQITYRCFGVNKSLKTQCGNRRRLTATNVISGKVWCDKHYTQASVFTSFVHDESCNHFIPDWWKQEKNEQVSKFISFSRFDLNTFSHIYVQMQHSFIEKIKELIGIDITCESLDLFKQSHMTYQEALFSFMLQKWPRVESDAYTYLVDVTHLSICNY